MMGNKVKNVEAWYDEKHRSTGIDTWRPLKAYRPILDYLDVQPGKKLLDVGFGTGHLLKIAAEKQLKTYGTDVSGEALRITEKNNLHARLVKARGEDLPFPDHFFDYVVCLGALEHFLDIEQGLSEIVRVSKPDGRLCIMVPNINYLFWKFRNQKGTEQKAISEQLFSLSEWRKIFRHANLEIVNIYQDQWPATRSKLFTDYHPAKLLKRIIIKSLWNWIPMNYTYQFIFILSPY